MEDGLEDGVDDVKVADVEYVDCCHVCDADWVSSVVEGVTDVVESVVELV